MLIYTLISLYIFLMLSYSKDEQCFKIIKYQVIAQKSEDLNLCMCSFDPIPDKDSEYQGEANTCVF
jgi:hypothetical protein